MSRVLVPDAGVRCSSSPAPARPTPAPTERARSRAWIMGTAQHHPARLVPHCDAFCPDRTYRRAHYCEKKKSLLKVGRLKFCPHHRAQLERRGWLDLGAGVRLEVPR